MNKDAIIDLPTSIDGLKEIVFKLQTDLSATALESARWQQKYELLLEQFKLAKQRQFTSSSEKNLLQMDLFDEAGITLPTQEEAPILCETVMVPEHERQRPKRQPIPAHFPRQEILHDIPDAEKQCSCGAQKARFGEEITDL